MDEEDGRSGARAVQTGRLDAHNDVRTLSLYPNHVAIPCSPTRVPRVAHGITLPVVILSKLIVLRTINAAKDLRFGIPDSPPPHVPHPFAFLLAKAWVTKFQVPPVHIPDWEISAPPKDLIQHKEKNENVPGK